MIMKTKNIQHWILAALFITVAACKPEIDAPKASAGDADFSKYIAIGNSLTAGFADGGLYLEGQKVAYPNLIAAQMKAVGGGDFTSPFFSEAQANGSGYIRLSGFNDDGTPITANVTDKLAYRNQAGLLTKYTEEVQNLGVPDMSIYFSQAAVMSSTSGNKYFERLVADADAGSKNYLEFTQGRNHTFFSFWLGNIDVLAWATSGGNAELSPTRQLTDKNTFRALYSQFINSLTSNNAKGVVATIPDVTAIPFFNTKTVTLINAALKAREQTKDLPGIYINALNTSTGLHAPRLATAEDLIILTFDTGLIGSGLGYGLSPLIPIEDKYVLDKDEVARAKEYTQDYNASIKQIANEKGLAFVDTYSILNNIKTPQIFDGIIVSSAFITGNAFSLDGVHLTPIGNAIVANAFIKAINEKYNSTIPTVAVSMYNGVKFP
jgi:phospholipase/lecithinase/hemolysin